MDIWSFVNIILILVYDKTSLTSLKFTPTISPLNEFKREWWEYEGIITFLVTCGESEKQCIAMVDFVIIDDVLST